MKNFPRPMTAIVRVETERIQDQWDHVITVKLVTPNGAWADEEVKRLNKLNGDKGCVYFATHTRFPDNMCTCGFDRMAADRMAACVDRMVRRGDLNSRSYLADARLNYGDPFPSDEADRMVDEVIR